MKDGLTLERAEAPNRAKALLALRPYADRPVTTGVYLEAGELRELARRALELAETLEREGSR